MKKINVALFGLGTIGSGVFEMIEENKERIKEEYNAEIVVKYIYVKNLNKKRAYDLSQVIVTNEAEQIVNDDSLDMIIECMGGMGLEITRDIVLKSLLNKKDVILSSKKCLALYGEEIYRTAKENNCHLRFEGTVGGGIPIMHALMNVAQGEEIHRVYGLLNATSNFILSSMTHEGMTYEEALLEAQKAGYAEQDPTDDVDGWDASYKLQILVENAMDVNGELTIQPTTITKVTMEEIKEAEKCGEVIKQVAMATKKADGTIETFVGPKRVNKNNLMALVSSNNNLIFVEGARSGIRAFYGQGAGKGPTASIMFDDIYDVIKERITNC